MSKLCSPRALWGAVLALPLVVLAYTWATTFQLAQQGEEWLVPVKGYDPADLLRGHFIQYRYDWPTDVSAADGQDDARNAFEPSYVSALCIEGAAPRIARVSALDATPADADSAKHSRCAIIARETLGTRQEVRGLDTGILYASESRAADLSAKLADPQLQGMVRVKIRPDGVMRPVDMEFRPRVPRE